MKRKKEFFGVLISVLVCVFFVCLIVYATTTISEDITIGNGGGMRIGSGSDATNFTALDDDSLFIEGMLEADGATWFDSVVSISGDFEVGSDKFTVAGTSGNTVVVGTLDVTGLANFVNASVSGDLEVTDIFGYDYTTDHNLWLGYLAGQDLAVGGQYNVFVGEEAGANITTGDWNTIVGYQAGYGLVGNHKNVAIGYNALYTSGTPADTDENVAIGYEALYSAGVETEANVAVGYKALRGIGDDGSRNVAVGENAGGNLVDDSDKNTLIGTRAGYGQAGVTSRNVFIGFQAGEDISTGTDNVAIGYMAGEGWLDDESNRLIITNTDTATPLIYGEFDNDYLLFNGSVSISSNFEVLGTASVSSDFTANGDVTINGILGYGSVVDLEIGGAEEVSITKSYHKITVAGGTGSGADDLIAINGGTEGQIIVIRSATGGGNDTVTVKDDTGNLLLVGDFVMDDVSDTLMLIYDGSNWLEISRSGNDD